MCAAMYRKRSSSFFDDPSQPEAAASPPPPSKRARFRGDGSPKPRAAAVNPDLVAALRARFPSVRLEFIEKALEECENNLDSAIKCLLPLRLEPTEFNVDPVYQSPNEMSTEVQVPNEDITECNEVPAPIENVPGADNLAPGITEWVEILMNEMMASASNPDEAKARVSRVLEAFHKSSISGIHTEAVQRFQKEFLSYKEQFEAVIKENTILKKAVAIQHVRQKEHDERNQELQQLKQLALQYREQIRGLEINNYALSMHLRQAQQGSSIPGHFHRDIL
ncbi:hypothetical protein QYE76_003976 [Lolium multiflorum]|uniref:CUE domain-containing protein n=1 Tax=Lolium multiflorum TaxID=4521 RepID=A0AAD8RPS0_LOLMU|nr:hypothetical protein QYE76_003976 [Lolium multiflorum]